MKCDESDDENETDEEDQKLDWAQTDFHKHNILENLILFKYPCSDI